MSTRVAPAEITATMGAEPTDEQWAAISWPLEPCVLIAGAGSGKTSVMAARVVYLALGALGRVDTPGVMPGNVLCLTFTNKATENLRLRVRRALAHLELAEGEEPEIMNYHGFAASLLDRYGVLAGFEPGARVLNQAQREELCGRVLDRMTFDHAAATYQPSLVSKILELDDQLQNHRVAPAEALAWLHDRLETLKAHRSERSYRAAEERIELTEAAMIYRELKAELGVIDYGDQIDRAIEIVTRFPDVVADHRARFQAVLLDEYQDTNVAQAELMGALFGGGHPVTAVGDPDQNIYAWRGASLYNLFRFSDDFPRADGTPAMRLPLYTNFRSGARILAAADTVIASVPEAQRPPGKRLVPWAARGQGEVRVRRVLDEWTEANAIADRCVELHAGGSTWAEMAVLCRTSRLFGLLRQAFDEREVPVEVVGLAGLLKMPEVVEVLAYARAVQDPTASVALARILLGPRYRVGFKDIALLARLASVETAQLRDAYDMEDDDVEAEPVLLAEALEHLEAVENLSDDGRERLAAFREELRVLRAEARRPVGEFLGEVIRRIGILDELDADPDRRHGLGARRNIAAFLDEVHAFEPVEGELTLRAFLDHIDAVERLDKQEWAPVQPSDADSVKVMTIHVAKGLEFDHVFVPGFAHGVLPNPEIPQNPAERGKSLDFELRGDADILPRYDGNLSRFKDALRSQELIEERRTAYVALTRARRTLDMSGAFWYGDNAYPKKESKFLNELIAWGGDSGLASVELSAAEAGEVNPMLGLRERFVRDWPGPAAPPAADDPAFADGWRATALDGAVQTSLVEALEPSARASFDALAADRVQLAAHLLEREAADRAIRSPGGDRIPLTLSASSLMDHALCPKRFYWTRVRPLPRFSGPAARIGTEIHRWIERRAAGQGRLLESDDAVDLTQEELAGDPGRVDRLRQAFLGSRFAERTPLFAERAFLLRVGAFAVGGRIDAIYGEADGPWEIVDWKTGSGAADPLQLELYGLACTEIWQKAPEDLTLTYYYLARDEAVSHPMGDPADVRSRVEATLASIETGTYEPTPGRWCTFCDFKGFCDAGKAWLAQNG
ncbi:MAG TPA: ATP-dependent DNA helicase [Actinomycetota bacterium]|nr:ATP-dependent DNA helicase [Actinomycetota bacterium]